MSGYEATAPLTGTLLSSKGAAAPSNSVASLMDDFDIESLATVRPAARAAPSPDDGVSGSLPDGTNQRRDGAKFPASSATAPKTAASKERIKLSLRLSDDQHLRLKLAAAHLRLSSQALLMTALDEYLARTVPGVRDGECNCLVSGVVDHTGPCNNQYCSNGE